MEPESPPPAQGEENDNNRKKPELCNSHRAFTVRRNPTRRARPQTPAIERAVRRTASPSPVSSIPFRVDEAPKPDKQPAAPPALKDSGAEARVCESLRVFLRIRPLVVKARPELKRRGGGGKARGICLPSKKDGNGGRKKKNEMSDSCLVVSGSDSVVLKTPPTYAVDPKKSKCEVYNGFSSVFPPDSLQTEVYQKVMAPLVSDLIEGKSGLLVAMGPTGSGKTHTMFGTPRDPGLVPLALQQVFCNDSRQCCLSMFEICSERGKSEKFFDLLSCEGELLFQQSTLKGLQEVKASSLVEAECLVARGMLKRATAATNANEESSRSQFVINIHVLPKSSNDEGCPSSGAILTVVDLAGAEREKKTGNQGTRLAESNFINNTSMVFGLCLRSLLEYQRNPKRALQKHFQNSLLTKYLRDYLEGKKRFTLILTVKPGEDDYSNNSFLLRQASPYMKIRFNNNEEVSNVSQQKRCVPSFCRFDREKRRKICDSEVLLVYGVGSSKDGSHDIRKDADSGRDVKSWENSVRCPRFNCKESAIGSSNEEHQVEMEGIKRNEQIMSCFARAIWNLLKEYKHKLEASETEVQHLKEVLGNERLQIRLLEHELQDLRSLNSVQMENNKHDHLEAKCDTIDLSSSAKQGGMEETSLEKDLLDNSVLEDLPISISLVAENERTVESCQGRHAPLMENISISKRPNTNGPKRRLLPASEMLLKEFSGLDISVANSKEGRVAEKSESVEERKRSQGNISLVCLLRSNLVK